MRVRNFLGLTLIGLLAMAQAVAAPAHTASHKADKSVTVTHHTTKKTHQRVVQHKTKKVQKHTAQHTKHKSAVKKKATSHKRRVHKAKKTTHQVARKVHRHVYKFPVTEMDSIHVLSSKLAMNAVVPSDLSLRGNIHNLTQLEESTADADDINDTMEPDSPSDVGFSLANAARDYLGIRYVYGGTSPKRGFDCSGLIYYTADKRLGVKLPRSARALARIGEPVSRQNLKPGDLVFFKTLNRHVISHVGIYLGGNQFIHAPRTGRNVSISSLNSSYWSKHYTTARRITKELTIR